MSLSINTKCPVPLTARTTGSLLTATSSARVFGSGQGYYVACLVQIKCRRQQRQWPGVEVWRLHGPIYVGQGLGTMACKARPPSDAVLWHHPRKQWPAPVGRMCWVPPNAGERYFLRVLLNHVAGCMSYEAIRTVNGMVQPTFRIQSPAKHRLSRNGILSWNLN